MKITVDLETLTKEEIAVLKRLQIEVVTKKSSKSRNGVKKQLNHLKPYTLEILHSCNLCKSEFSRFFKLKKFKKGLKSKERFNQLILSNVKKERKVSTCKKCKKVLLSMPKERIIQKYLKEKGVVSERRRKFGGTF